jgi:pimeloyl-ACP methyl ester carboxylesterase
VKRVRTPDGRSLEVIEAGPEDGVPILVHHGTPGAAALFGPSVEAGAERGFRHVAWSRPGYGESDRLPGRSIADCVPDVTAVADALGIERFHTLGGSGGGPHALACARLLPDRVISATTIASGAPADAPGLDWTAGMGRENLEEFAAARAGEQELRDLLEREAATLAAVTPEEIVGGLGDDLVSDADRSALAGPLGEHVARQLERALSSGIWGWFDDDMAFLAPWGFDLRCEVPVTLWHGGRDRFVPVAHGEWLAANVDGAVAHVLPDHGHLSLTVNLYGEILDALPGA